MTITAKFKFHNMTQSCDVPYFTIRLKKNSLCYSRSFLRDDIHKLYVSLSGEQTQLNLKNICQRCVIGPDNLTLTLISQTICQNIQKIFIFHNKLLDRLLFVHTL